MRCVEGGVCMRRTTTIERPTSYHDLDVPVAGFRHRSGRNTAPEKDRLVAVCLQERKIGRVRERKEKSKGGRCGYGE